MALLLVVVTIGSASLTSEAQPSLSSNASAYRLPDVAWSFDVAETHARADTTLPHNDPWLGRDKFRRAGGSFLLTLSGQYVLTDKTGMSDRAALPLSAVAALGIGLTKEILDSQRARYPQFSWRDLAADALGVALGVGVANL